MSARYEIVIFAQHKDLKQEETVNLTLSKILKMSLPAHLKMTD